MRCLKFWASFASERTRASSIPLVCVSSIELEGACYFREDVTILERIAGNESIEVSLRQEIIEFTHLLCNRKAQLTLLQLALENP